MSTLGFVEVWPLGNLDIFRGPPFVSIKSVTFVIFLRGSQLGGPLPPLPVKKNRPPRSPAPDLCVWWPPFLYHWCVVMNRVQSRLTQGIGRLAGDQTNDSALVCVCVGIYLPSGPIYWICCYNLDFHLKIKASLFWSHQCSIWTLAEKEMIIV